MSDVILHSDLAGIPKAGESVFGRKRWRLWVLAVEVAIIGSAVAFLHWPVIKVTDVTYEGPAEWESEVRSLVTIPSDGNLLHFLPSAAESNIQSRFSERADAQVRIELPGRINIRMTAFLPRLWGDGETGIARDGALLLNPVLRPELPRWVPGIQWQESLPIAERARFAAAAWEELSNADRRYELVTAEWTCDPVYGWMTTAVDGRTKVALGHTRIGDRARCVAELLNQGDTLLAKPCFIDARFDGRLLLWPIPEPKHEKPKNDSTAAVVAVDSQPDTKDAGNPPGKPAKGRT